VTDGPVEVDVFYDFHCPYCFRAVEWLAALGPDVVQPTFRLFALEQVNRDPEAREWRLWEQPLDYEHYRGRQDRRPLAAFLAMTHVEATERTSRRAFEWACSPPASRMARTSRD
jgi:hypothetical protein